MDVVKITISTDFMKGDLFIFFFSSSLETETWQIDTLNENLLYFIIY